MNLRRLSLFACLVASWACAGAPPAPAAAPSSPPAAPASPASDPVASHPPAVVPDGPAGQQLAWVLGALAKAPSEADAATHFTPEFLAKVPAATVVALFAQISTAAPFTFESISPAKNGSPSELVAVVRGNDGTRLKVWLVVDPATGRMTGLLLRPKVDAKASG
jgi:hypothetical protein